MLSRTDRRRHLYLIGQTGTGKSTLLRELIAQDIEAGEGIALIDPHGDLAHDVLARVPPRRIDDVVLLDPSDIAHPVGLNPFYRVPADERALVAGNLVASMKHIWRDSWGPRLEYILYNVIAATLEAPDHVRPSILSLPLILVRPQYRAKVLRHVEDPRVRSFFKDEFETWNERLLIESLSPVQNKIGALLSNPFIRNILGQWRPSIDLADIMERRKILIVRLSKGTLGEEPANLLGSLIASGFQQAAMRRASIPEADRRDFNLYIDEFHNFTTDAFASVLSEARKYGLTLTVAHQYLEQLNDEVRAAVFGNVGSVVSFRVSAPDAEHLAHEVGEYAPATFRDLARGQICARLVADGAAGTPCRGTTEPENAPRYDRTATIIERCRRRDGRKRAEVEKRVRSWLSQ
ncbi:type IV secretory system conjugative DNA transfer family protein [Microbaculum sp. FT89]|uniref:type IV secretory system conjugative DNA transfer family protein n=1 Tax=Microbaculum sp. FT89 TaxID=3447298 RepID=UPI003F52C1FD